MSFWQPPINCDQANDWAAMSVMVMVLAFRMHVSAIYLDWRYDCDQVAGHLKKAGLEAESYHAGLTDNQRVSVQERWLNERRCKVWILL